MKKIKIVSVVAIAIISLPFNSFAGTVFSRSKNPSLSKDCKVLDPLIGFQYQGECRNGLAHGKGKAMGKPEIVDDTKILSSVSRPTAPYFRQNSYVGWFRNGLPHGEGVYTWANGIEGVGGTTPDLKKGLRISGIFFEGKIDGLGNYCYTGGYGDLYSYCTKYFYIAGKVVDFSWAASCEVSGDNQCLQTSDEDGDVSGLFRFLIDEVSPNEPASKQYFIDNYTVEIKSSEATKERAASGKSFFSSWSGSQQTFTYNIRILPKKGVEKKPLRIAVEWMMKPEYIYNDGITTDSHTISKLGIYTLDEHNNYTIQDAFSFDIFIASKGSLSSNSKVLRRKRFGYEIDSVKDLSP